MADPPDTDEKENLEDLDSDDDSEDRAEPIEPETNYLIARAKEGDLEARERLFQRYAPRARQIAALRMGRPVSSLGTIDDIVQDALLSVVRKLETFEVRSEGGFRNYVARCVETAIVDAVRGKHDDICASQIRDFDMAEVIHRRQPTPSATAHERELSERIEAKLLGLKAHDRELIILRRLCGMSCAEIAKELGFEAEGTVRVYVSRALRKLKTALAL